MVADRIKQLRENTGMTQSELAKKLTITRSSVNAWEQGISVPSTQFIIELAHIFKVSTDYLLCVDNSATINIEGLSEKDITIIHELIAHLRNLNMKNKYNK
ncbi:MAG: helix-turn-helix domain-containing protein [Anaerotignaceae bacterium]